MSDKKPEIIPINMVYQSNSKIHNCKVLINRSDGNLVSNFELPSSSNSVQGIKHITRVQSVVKVTSSQPIVRTISGARVATLGRVLGGGTSQQPTLIMQPTKSLINPQSVQKNQLSQQSVQKFQQKPITQTQTILIPQSIKSPNSIIYQALPLSTTQRINKSFIKRSTSNTTIDLDSNPSSTNNSNLTKSCNNISNIGNNKSIKNIIGNNTMVYRLVGEQSSHIKTTSIIKAPCNTTINKSKSMTIINNPQQLNKSSQQSAITQRLILPATNQYQVSFAGTKQGNSLLSPSTASTPSHIIKKESNTDPVNSEPSKFNNLSFSLIPNSVRVSIHSDTTPPNNNNNIVINNNNTNNIMINNSNNSNNTSNSIILNDSNDESYSLDYVQGYKSKVNEQQGKAQHWLSSIESKLRQRKPCNCTKSQCLKLYCECFANGEFCKDCNCCNCANNLEHEDERARAVRNCIERNPHAFHPKIGKGGSNRQHNKGCNCKRSGCLKNYCECYEAKILCSHLCRCISCRNYEDSSDRQKLMQLADVAEARVQQQTAADNKLSMHILGASSPVKPNVQSFNGQRPPYTFVTLDVIEAISSCLIAEADDHSDCSSVVQEKYVLEEFGRCLSQVIEMASKSKTASP